MPFNHMMLKDNWKDAKARTIFLAQCLKEGSLALVLGAGASDGCGLPDWKELISRLYRISGKVLPASETTLEGQADHFFVDICSSDETQFAAKTQEALYEGVKTDAAALAKIRMLAALGAMTMGSRRGSVRNIITFNFDNLLETYLSYFGYIVSSIDKLPTWAKNSDVEVLHVHGLLRHDEAVKAGDKIIMTKAHFDKVVGNNGRPEFASKTRDILSSHVCLFIGLSGDDNNLTGMLEYAKEEHVTRHAGLPYWGIRFSNNENDPRRSAWERKNICQWTVLHYDNIPDELFKICQEAAKM